MSLSKELVAFIYMFGFKLMMYPSLNNVYQIDGIKLYIAQSHRINELDSISSYDVVCRCYSSLGFHTACKDAYCNSNCQFAFNPLLLTLSPSLSDAHIFTVSLLCPSFHLKFFRNFLRHCLAFYQYNICVKFKILLIHNLATQILI